MNDRQLQRIIGQILFKIFCKSGISFLLPFSASALHKINTDSFMGKVKSSQVNLL